MKDFLTQLSKAGFASRAALARHRAGLTAPELAAACGVTKYAVYKWENGKSEPTVTNLVLLARATNTPIEWLCVGSPAYDRRASK